jgi:hypothetical protein
MQLLRCAHRPGTREVIKVIKAGDKTIKVRPFGIINISRRAIEGRSDVDVGVNHRCSSHIALPETGDSESSGRLEGRPLAVCDKLSVGFAWPLDRRHVELRSQAPSVTFGACASATPDRWRGWDRLTDICRTG